MSFLDRYIAPTTNLSLNTLFSTLFFTNVAGNSLNTFGNTHASPSFSGDKDMANDIEGETFYAFNATDEVLDVVAETNDFGSKSATYSFSISHEGGKTTSNSGGWSGIDVFTPQTDIFIFGTDLIRYAYYTTGASNDTITVSFTATRTSGGNTIQAQIRAGTTVLASNISGTTATATYTTTLGGLYSDLSISNPLNLLAIIET